MASPQKQKAIRAKRRSQMRLIQKRRERNYQRKSTLRKVLKQTETAISAGDAQQAQTLYRQSVSQLDRTAQKGVIKKGTANRRKSRLALKLNKIAVA
ncbi:30S ribosomal protein S20 [Candidatus Poribacteria bacterium]|nr:30S ribosomal protein S20 [Candidatus Poribacteria bacterium]